MDLTEFDILFHQNNKVDEKFLKKSSSSFKQSPKK